MLSIMTTYKAAIFFFKIMVQTMRSMPKIRSNKKFRALNLRAYYLSISCSHALHFDAFFPLKAFSSKLFYAIKPVKTKLLGTGKEF